MTARRAWLGLLAINSLWLGLFLAPIVFPELNWTPLMLVPNGLVWIAGGVYTLRYAAALAPRWTGSFGRLYWRGGGAFGIVCGIVWVLACAGMTIVRH